MNLIIKKELFCVQIQSGELMNNLFHSKMEGTSIYINQSITQNKHSFH